MRSIDPSTKCGAVLVSKQKKILSTGYNGPIKGSQDHVVPLIRPAKYAHILHAEENCLLAYNGSNQDLEGATIYVTSRPCHKCLRMILQKGIKHIVYGEGNLGVMQDSDEKEIVDQMLQYSPAVDIRSVNNLEQVMQMLSDTQTYIKKKNPDRFLDA